MSLWLLLAMIVYPVSQLFYSVLLLPPALTLWSRRAQIPGGAWTAAVVVAAVWTLAAFRDGTRTIAASLLLWAALALCGVLRLARERRNPAAFAAREAEAITPAPAPTGAS
jgi:hypothetical protein